MSIIAERMKKHMNLIKKYQSDNNLDFLLSLNDATEEELKSNAVPIFEVGGKKMGKTEFLKIIEKVEDKVFEKKAENEYTVKGRINAGYTGIKWNPEPIYEDYKLTFKCWNCAL